MMPDAAAGSRGIVLRAIRARILAAALAVALAIPLAAWAERTRLKPGFNLFSPQQDVDLGGKLAGDVPRQMPMLNDRTVDSYVDRLGKRLAAKAPGERYPYQFRVVNDRGINAFALPGGYIFVNRGVIEAADNEAQLASVISHEIGHVALRHGTNQASKAQAASLPLAILGGLAGNSAAGMLAQLGAGFTLNSVLLKYSRDAERQADILGAQILYDNGYDPRAGQQFFEKVEAEEKRGRPPQWLSSHPNPENRQELISREVSNLGGPPPGYKTDSGEFREIKRRVLSLPAPPKGGRSPAADNSGSPAGPPPPPSSRARTLDTGLLRMKYPENWNVGQEGNSVNLIPDRGVVTDGRGNTALAYGVMVSVSQVPRNVSLEEATESLLQQIRQSNPGARISRQPARARLDGQRALSTHLSNDSPVGSLEVDWVVTVLRPDGLVAFICVAPERDFPAYERTFRSMLDSVRFPR